MKTVIKSGAVYVLVLVCALLILRHPAHGLIITTENQTDCTVLYAINRYLRTYYPIHKVTDFGNTDKYTLRLGEPIYIIADVVKEGKLDGRTGKDIANFLKKYIDPKLLTKMHVFVFTSYAGTAYNKYLDSLVSDICTELIKIGVEVEVRGPDGYAVTDSKTAVKYGPRIVQKDFEPAFFKLLEKLKKKYQERLSGCSEGKTLEERIDSAASNKSIEDLHKELLKDALYFYNEGEKLTKKTCP